MITIVKYRAPLLGGQLIRGTLRMLQYDDAAKAITYNYDYSGRDYIICGVGALDIAALLVKTFGGAYRKVT